ncbi:MAG TPA: GntR family transcriptional regulator [Phycisphaerae bacterium]|nr:GntR family transcriptional regulator [Phycisphaerae bacterium]
MSTIAAKDEAFRESGTSQRDQAYYRLRRLLILQQTPEGKRLREAEWAEKLGVNRTALREAFARLEAEGLIEKGPITGYFVPELTHAEILEICEVRVLLEGGAIERICRLGLNTLRVLKPLRQACDQLERLLEEAYYLGVAEADRRYHEALIQAAGNKRLSMLYERAPLPIIPPNIVSGAEWNATVRRTLEEHRGILDALLAGDKNTALETLRTHLSERSLIPLCAV